MAYREVIRSTGPIKKWDTVGDTVEGIFRGLKSGKTFAGNSSASQLAILDTDKGPITIGCPTVLAATFQENVSVGAKVRVTYLGVERGQRGGNYKNFRVEVDEAQSVTNPQPSPVEHVHMGDNGVFNEYFSKLSNKVGADTARLMRDMLDRSYPTDQAEKINALKTLLKQQGVEV